VQTCSGGSAAGDYRDAQVRSLDVASRGASLDQGRVLRQSGRYPVIEQAFAGPDGDDITAFVFSGTVTSSGQWSRVSVDRTSAATGAVLSVDYQRSGYLGEEGYPGNDAVIPDASGRSLLLFYPGTHELVLGWLGGGQVQQVPYVMSPFAC